jgi:hypothetical protein
LIKASLRKGTDKIDAEGGRIIKMYYYANKELYMGLKTNWIPFIKLHETLQEYPP